MFSVRILFYVIRGRWNQNHTGSTFESVESIPEKDYVGAVDVINILSSSGFDLGDYRLSIFELTSPITSASTRFWDEVEGKVVIALVCLILLIVLLILLICICRRRRDKKTTT